MFRARHPPVVLRWPVITVLECHTTRARGRLNSVESTLKRHTRTIPPASVGTPTPPAAHAIPPTPTTPVSTPLTRPPFGSPRRPPWRFLRGGSGGRSEGALRLRDLAPTFLFRRGRKSRLPDAALSVPSSPSPPHLPSHFTRCRTTRGAAQQRS